MVYHGPAHWQNISNVPVPRSEEIGTLSYGISYANVDTIPVGGI